MAAWQPLGVGMFASIVFAMSAILAFAFSATTTSARAAEVSPCPPWQCVPGTAGEATLTGNIKVTVVGKQPHGASARYAGVEVVYRRTAVLDGKPAGPLRQTRVNAKGEFAVVLPACSPAVRAFGCSGGTFELYPAHDGQPCGEPGFVNMTAGETTRIESPFPPGLCEFRAKKAELEKEARQRK